MPEPEEDIKSVDQIRAFFRHPRPDLLYASEHDKSDKLEAGIPDFPIVETALPESGRIALRSPSNEGNKALRKPSHEGTSGIFSRPPSDVGKKSLGGFTTTSVKTASSCKILALEAVESLFDQLETVKSEQFDAQAKIQDANRQRDEAIQQRNEAIEEKKHFENQLMAANFRVQELLTALRSMQKENYLFESALREAISGLGKGNEKIRIMKADHRKVCDELMSEKLKLEEELREIYKKYGAAIERQRNPESCYLIQEWCQGQLEAE